MLMGVKLRQSATVNGPPPIVSNATTTASSCSNVSDGSVDLTVVGGALVTGFVWTPGNSTDEDLNGVEFGTYTVEITDQDGCSITATYSVGTLVDIAAEAGLDDTVCVSNSIMLEGTEAEITSGHLGPL